MRKRRRDKKENSGWPSGEVDEAKGRRMEGGRKWGKRSRTKRGTQGKKWREIGRRNSSTRGKQLYIHFCPH